jgi:ATPase subunit of ABC transporter with duplicated ATPase domains
MILHLELTEKKQVPKHTVIRSTYDEYIEKRLRGLVKQTQVARKEQAQYQSQMAKLDQIMSRVDSDLNNISRSDPHGARMLAKKMKSLKAQERRFEDKVLTKIPDYEEAINCFFGPTNLHKQKEVLKMYLSTLQINNKVLAENIHLEIIGPSHIVIIGKNGIGKTTLIRSIYQILSKRDDLKVGYMPQNYDDILNDYSTPIDFLVTTGDKEENALIRSYMGNMNFTRDEMTGPINNLSGGSKAKLFILKLILDKCNVLILDEPTRNVSPLSNPVIRNILKSYDGAIISISHDRKYINEVADTIYELTSNGLKEITSL